VRQRRNPPKNLFYLFDHEHFDGRWHGEWAQMKHKWEKRQGPTAVICV